ncbi:mas-related G-protein coupled receptor member B2-like [Chionomys nivalis]|uniref:mas-related G-protein coupled receptor member B2-like n=1 Tax=Chionomys nivalis TaxID=269649 RepID=UPI00259AD10B|nr:mas-related G-protein coupled receptor member B2-like [Chionomys nivalis]
MEQRSISGDFLNKDSNISTWDTTITAPNGSIYTDSSYCNIIFQAIIFLSLIFVLVGLAGNAIVMWLLGFRMHRNAFSVYILNLAVADFLFLSFEFVYFLHLFLYIFYSIPIYIHMPWFYPLVPTIAYLSGLSILSAISVERCLSVLWPIWYRCRRPRHTSAVTCALLWALSLLLSLLHGEERGFLFNCIDTFWCQTFDYITSSWPIVLFVVLCASSLTLLVQVFCGTQRIPVTRLYAIIVLTVLFFLIFALPLGIVFFFCQLFGYLCFVKSCDTHLLLFLCCVNSCANPFIYFIVGSIRHRRLQRKTLKLFLQRALQDTPEEETCGERGSSEEHGELGFWEGVKDKVKGEQKHCHTTSFSHVLRASEAQLLCDCWGQLTGAPGFFCCSTGLWECVRQRSAWALASVFVNCAAVSRRRATISTMSIMIANILLLLKVLSHERGSQKTMRLLRLYCPVQNNRKQESHGFGRGYFHGNKSWKETARKPQKLA